MKKLPDKWCIHRELYPEVQEYFTTLNKTSINKNNYSKRFNGWYTHYPKINGDYHADDYVHCGYEIISIEEFREFVLNPIPENWYVVVTNTNLEIVKKWFLSKEPGSTKSFSMGAAYGMINGKLDAATYPRDFKGVEISTETFKKLILKEDNIFPKDWCIKVTQENKDVLNKWRDTVAKSNKGYIVPVGYSILSKHHSDNSHYYSGSRSDLHRVPYYKYYKEITFEEFKKHVLKDTPDEEIPEKWKIKITDELLEFGKVFRKSKDKNSIWDYKKYSWLSFTGLVWNNEEGMPKDYQDITSKQFKTIIYKLGFTSKTDLLFTDLGDIEFLRNYPEILEDIKQRSSNKTLDVYIKNRLSDQMAGGFNWTTSKEGHPFWKKVIEDRNPQHYYTLYPRVASTIALHNFQKENIIDIKSNICSEIPHPAYTIEYVRTEVHIKSKPKTLPLVKVKQRRII